MKTSPISWSKRCAVQYVGRFLRHTSLIQARSYTRNPKNVSLKLNPRTATSYNNHLSAVLLTTNRRALTASATSSDSAGSSLAFQSQPDLAPVQYDQQEIELDPFTPLTKAPKAIQSSGPTQPSPLQQASKAAGYAALAVGAGIAVSVLKVDVTDAALAGAVLAAGKTPVPILARCVLTSMLYLEHCCFPASCMLPVYTLWAP